MKRFFFSFALFLAIVLLMPQEGLTQSRPEKNGPVITQAWAIDSGRLGTVLKLYIEANDPNGDMLRIATVIDKVGQGHHPTDWTFIKPQDSHHVMGYLQWNTLSSMSGRIDEWTRLTIQVSVFDKSGNESNVVVFPFTFETTGLEPKLPAPFDKGNIPKLGNVMTEIRGTTDAHP